jgi:hypothetical protein
MSMVKNKNGRLTHACKPASISSYLLFAVAIGATGESVKEVSPLMSLRLSRLALWKFVDEAGWINHLVTSLPIYSGSCVV